MAVLFVFAVLVLVAARALPAAVRGFRRLSLDDVRTACSIRGRGTFSLRARGAGGIRAFVFACIAAALTLAAYALVRLRDFHNSGSPDLATYAVSDNLGSGLVLLLIVPIVALALGSLSAGLAAGPTKDASEKSLVGRTPRSRIRKTGVAQVRFRLCAGSRNR
jgi:hypothetical protein